MTYRKAAQLFVVGNSRSGTTMLGRALGRHSNIHTFHELHFFEQQIEAEAIETRLAEGKKPCEALVERLLTSERDGIFSSVQPRKYTDEARRIVSCGFLHEALEKIPDPDLIEWIAEMIEEKFNEV